MVPLILVIDDSPTVCSLIMNTLVKIGYEVKSFSDGTQVVNWSGSNDSRVPNLILVDVGLPDMDGYILIQKLHSQFTTVPFVVITRQNGFLDRLKARLVGVTMYLVKPFSMNQLITVVRILTSKSD